MVENLSVAESLTFDEKAKDALFIVSEGDCRRVENILQSAAAISKNITEDLIFSMASVARPKEVKETLELALANKFIEARNKLLNTMLDYGLSGIDIIKQIQKEIYQLDISNRKKMELIKQCGEAEFRLSEGSDAFVQLEAFLAHVALVGE